MPLIKGPQASSLLKEAVVLDLGDIGRQAARITAAAEARAQVIEQQARQRAQELGASAGTEGFERGRADGYAKGLEEGRKKGHDEAFAQAAAQLKAVSQSFTQAVQGWDQGVETLINETRQSALELSLHLAEKLVHRIVEVDGSVVVDQVGAAMAHVLGATEMTVKINPDDRPVLEAAMPGLLAEFAHFKHVHLMDEATMLRGGCIVTYGQGEIDATLETQLARAVELILPADVEASLPPAVEPDNGKSE